MNIAENSKAKLFLIVAVCIIWGAIIVKAFSVFNASDDIPDVNQAFVGSKQKYKIEVDTFSLMLNYRDPFLSGISNRSNKPATSSTKKISKPTQIKTNSDTKCVWPSLIFGGIIHNNSSNADIALIKINGKKRLLKVGDQANDITVVLVTSDSVMVIKDQCRKTIYRK